MSLLLSTPDLDGDTTKSKNQKNKPLKTHPHNLPLRKPKPPVIHLTTDLATTPSIQFCRRFHHKNSHTNPQFSTLMRNATKDPLARTHARTREKETALLQQCVQKEGLEETNKKKNGDKVRYLPKC
jgi:hypothetical protein